MRRPLWLLPQSGPVRPLKVWMHSHLLNSAGLHSHSLDIRSTRRVDQVVTAQEAQHPGLRVRAVVWASVPLRGTETLRTP